MKVLLKNGYLVDPSASAVPELPVSVLLEDGRIAAVGAGLDAGDAEVYDCTGLYIMPGVIDAHTHIGYGSERTPSPAALPRSSPTTARRRTTLRLYPPL